MVPRKLAGDFDVFQFSLISYHGKKLAEMRIPMEDPDILEDTKLGLLEDLATNDIHLCQGIQDVRERQFKQYLNKSKDKVLDKVRNAFYIEPLEEECVLRARTCHYIVRNPVRNNDPNANDFIRSFLNFTVNFL